MRELADGLAYRRERWHDANVHVLEVDLDHRRIEPVPIGETYPWNSYHETPPQLAEAAGALASIGGDFGGGTSAGVPIPRQTEGAFMLSGELWTSGQRNSPKVVFSQGRAYLSTDRFVIDMVRADGVEIGVGSLNGLGDPNALSPRSARDAPDLAKHVIQLSAPHQGTRRVLPVVLLPLPPGQLLVESTQPLPVQVDDVVVWRRTLGGDDRMQHIVAGHPVLVRRGINAIDPEKLDPEAPHGPDNWFVRVNPRMAIGLEREGRIVYLVSVEGRIPGSAGLRLKELATLMLRLGAWNAINLDGGGSAHMWTRRDGLVMDGCYGNGTIAGCRPEPYATAVF